MEKIKATDLRIGNLVLVHSHYVAEVHTIQSDIIGVKTVGEPNAQIDLINLKYIEPVIITEQILLDFGFKPENDKWFLAIYGSEYEVNNFKINLESKRVYICEIDEDIKGGGYVAYRVEFIHQLQNIFHSLTNKELIKK